MTERAPLTGRAAKFSADEFIVSKTNTKGIITYANDVFLRVAGYTQEEVLGKPHNIIRHPAMPRCVFRLLWERIRMGNEIFAYVLNRAKNGDHYWVLAHVTPSFDAKQNIIGFHSNRRLPRAEVVQAVEPLYAQLRQIEDSAATPGAGIDAAGAQLRAWVDSHGGNYDEIMFTL